MLEIIKKALRFTSTELDDDIQYNIDACLLDLERVGVNTDDQTDKRIIKAVELYCKWQYDFLSQGERFFAHYELMRNSLSRCEELRNE